MAQTQLGGLPDTELPDAGTLADNMANPTVPGVGAYTMVYDSVGNNWDRAAAITLVDADTGSGTVLIPQVNIVQRASGGPTETFTLTNPAYVQLKGTATYTEPATPTDIAPVWGFPWIYNALASTWYRQVQAQITYSSAGLDRLGLPIHVIAGQYDDTSPDTPAENTFHHFRMTQYRAMHSNLRTAAGAETGLVGAPLFVGPSTASRDARTESFLTIDHRHKKIHEGVAFFYANTQTGVGSGASIDYMVTTPNTTKWAHMLFDVDSELDATVTIYEQGDRTGTTAQTLYNQDRNSAIAATITIHIGTSGGTTDGTAIWSMRQGTATGSAKIGLNDQSLNEVILKQNTKYIVRVTSNAASNKFNIRFNWYEHTNVA